MEFTDNAPGALVRCKYCSQVFGAPVYHNCPDAPDVDPEVQKRIEADPQDEDEEVVIFENGNRYHEKHPNKDAVAVCPATDENEGEIAKRAEAQSEGLILCKVCADKVGIDYDVEDDAEFR